MQLLRQHVDEAALLVDERQAGSTRILMIWIPSSVSSSLTFYMASSEIGLRDPKIFPLQTYSRDFKDGFSESGKDALLIETGGLDKAQSE
jgi:hypothetical protein